MLKEKKKGKGDIGQRGRSYSRIRGDDGNEERRPERSFLSSPLFSFRTHSPQHAVGTLSRQAPDSCLMAVTLKRERAVVQDSHFIGSV